MSRPLWEVMNESLLTVPGDTPVRTGDHFIALCYAAELRALAEIVEQRGDQGLDLDPGETADWLRAEADRAEG
jgi:hypothetical protein